MKNFKVHFEFNGQKYLSQVSASCESEAHLEVYKKISFLQVTEVTAEPVSAKQKILSEIILGILNSELSRVRQKMSSVTPLSGTPAAEEYQLLQRHHNFLAAKITDFKLGNIPVDVIKIDLADIFKPSFK